MLKNNKKKRAEDKNRGGRPRKELTDEDFAMLVGMIKIQCTQVEICDILGMTPETLNTRLQERGEGSFSTLYEKNQSEGRASLRRMQWKAASDGNPTMLIWLGKQVLGQRDKMEHTGKDGGPIQTQDVTEAALIEQATRLGLDPSILGLTGNPQKSD